MRTREIEEGERNTLAHGLRVAADQYAADAAELRKPLTDATAEALAARPRLAAQFDRQEAEARALADRIEQAAKLIITEG